MEETKFFVDLHTCIQGEGPLAGVPHILMRFSGCNLRCAFKDGLCDTAYASWITEQAKYSMRHALEMLSANPQINMVLITGGEPTLSLTNLNRVVDIICAFAERAGREIKISMETNGTKYIGDDLLAKMNKVIISPKLSNSNPIQGVSHEVWKGRSIEVPFDENGLSAHARNRLNFPALKGYVKALRDYPDYPPFNFKFVANSPESFFEIAEILDKLASDDVEYDKLVSLTYVMPEGVTPEQLAEKRQMLIEQCITLGFNYTDRLHILAYGNKREA